MGETDTEVPGPGGVPSGGEGRPAGLGFADAGTGTG